jgi:hypothetical protein
MQELQLTAHHACINKPLGAQGGLMQKALPQLMVLSNWASTFLITY